MDISASGNIITIIGNIKSVSDFQTIKSTIDSIKSSHNAITIDIKDSISITSSVIGYLNKLVLKESIDLNLKVGDTQLIELLDDLNLKALFKARRR